MPFLLLCGCGGSSLIDLPVRGPGAQAPSHRNCGMCAFWGLLVGMIRGPLKGFLDDAATQHLFPLVEDHRLTWGYGPLMLVEPDPGFLALGDKHRLDFGRSVPYLDGDM